MRSIRAGVRGRTRPWIDRGTNHRVGWRRSDNPRTLIRQRNDAARSRGGRWCGHRSGSSLWNSRRCLRLWNRGRRRSSHCCGYRRSSLGDHRGRHGCCRSRRLGWFWGGGDWSNHRPRRRNDRHRPSHKRCRPRTRRCNHLRARRDTCNSWTRRSAVLGSLALQDRAHRIAGLRSV